MILVFKTKLFIVKTVSNFRAVPQILKKSKIRRRRVPSGPPRTQTGADLRNPPPSLVGSPLDQWTSKIVSCNILITLTFGILSEKL